jgi:DNA-binding MarR family transcriptional regulator
MDFKVLYALNSHEKTITQVFQGTKMGYSDVHRTIYDLEKRGYLKILGMRKHNMGVFVKSTQKGINITVEWQNIHNNNF